MTSEERFESFFILHLFVVFIYITDEFRFSQPPREKNVAP